MGNISWRSQASSEDTEDSSLQGDLDEDTGKETHLESEGCWFDPSPLQPSLASRARY